MAARQSAHHRIPTLLVGDLHDRHRTPRMTHRAQEHRIRGTIEAPLHRTLLVAPEWQALSVPPWDRPELPHMCQALKLSTLSDSHVSRVIAPSPFPGVGQPWTRSAHTTSNTAPCPKQEAANTACAHDAMTPSRSE